MRNFLAAGLGLCAAGCFALAAIPVLIVPAAAVCGAGAVDGAGGLMLGKAAPNETVP